MSNQNDMVVRDMATNVPDTSPAYHKLVSNLPATKYR